VAAAAAALALAGCSSATENKSEADSFLVGHIAAAARVAAATKAVEAEAAALPRSATAAELGRLGHAAAQGRRGLVTASEWDVAGEGAEEEDLPRAESELSEGADELAHAMSALEAYARAPRASALARYERELSVGREQWNEGISQVWYLDHRPNPPIV
jgi:hypothetical protein